MKEYDVIRFLNSAKRFLEDDIRGNFSHKLDSLIAAAEEGKNPCDFCEKNESCGNLLCLPFYIYFRKCWRSIQRSAGYAKPRN